jgi:hypothetical protein
VGPAGVSTAPSLSPRQTTLTTVDSSGQHTSITIGANGFPVISYYTSGGLKVAKCGNASCSAGNTLTTVDSGGGGPNTSITIGADGFPVISYSDYTNGHLKVAKCSNASCSSGKTITTVDSTGSVGEFTSITIGADGFPVISYSDYATNYDLKVAKCINAACSGSSTISTVDSTVFVGRYTSITIGADGFPVISYYDNANGGLKVAKCGNASCSTGNTLTTIASGVNDDYTSITIGADGFPVISYTNGGLMVAKCANKNCLNNWWRR